MPSPFLRALPAAAFSLLALAADADEIPSRFAIMAPVDAVVDAVNAHEAKLPDHTFATRCTIVDEFSPYLWFGAGAGTSWYSSLVGVTPAEQQHFQDLRAHFMIGDPRFLRADANHVYFVIEATLTSYDQGVRKRSIGQWTITEAQTGDHWLIDSMVWGTLRED